MSKGLVLVSIHNSLSTGKQVTDPSLSVALFHLSQKKRSKSKGTILWGVQFHLEFIGNIYVQYWNSSEL